MFARSALIGDPWGNSLPLGIVATKTVAAHHVPELFHRAYAMAPTKAGPQRIDPQCQVQLRAVHDPIPSDRLPDRVVTGVRLYNSSVLSLCWIF